MNNINQYIFDLDHVLAHLRDTLEYVLPSEHDEKVFEQRKAVLTKALDEETPLGKFFKNNEEQFKETIEKYKEMLEAVYGDKSKIVSKGPDGKIRVDHTQNIKLFQYVVELADPIKDILYYHYDIATKNKENEAVVDELLKIDDNYYRVFVNLLLVQEFQKSFIEFQKVMSESEGKPTPQSNFIVQNELVVMAKLLRDLRSHTRFIDNKTLDLLDKVLQLVEMTEGRRERRDNKSFPELFKDVITNLNDVFVKELTAPWREKFDTALKEMIDQISKNSAPKK